MALTSMRESIENFAQLKNFDNLNSMLWLQTN